MLTGVSGKPLPNDCPHRPEIVVAAPVQGEAGKTLCCDRRSLKGLGH